MFQSCSRLLYVQLNGPQIYGLLVDLQFLLSGAAELPDYINFRTGKSHFKLINMIKLKSIGAVLILPVIFAANFAFEILQDMDNTLTDKEKKEGWVLLFDGKSVNGWRGYKNIPTDGWEVINGEIHCKETGVQKRADLITVDAYDNFELSIDWKVSKANNSGVIWRVSEDYGASFESGPEYQLIDDNGYADKLEDWQKSGADYAMYTPSKLMAKGPGEYNRTVIKVNDSHVTYWLNGDKVVEYDLWTDDWKKRKANSKWKDARGYGMNKKGHIALQDHGGGVWFKNIKLKKI